MSETSVFFTAEFWVLVAFVVFCLVIFRMRVHKSMLSAVDDRSNRIRTELDEARRLREEAQQVLADYQKRRTEAEAEAESIVAAARAEAERLASEAKTKAEEFVARRTKMAETKIAQAEAQAVAEVRGIAADAAAAAAELVLAAKVKGATAERLVERGIADLRAKLH